MLLRPAQRCAGHRGAVCRALHTVLKAEPTSIYTAATIAGKGAPTIVIDLDETILYRHRGFLDFLLLYLAPRALAGRPYESAVEAINALATRFRFVSGPQTTPACPHNIPFTHALFGMALHCINVCRLPSRRVGGARRPTPSLG